MAHAAVLIVGAGALGIVTGYHLQQAGAEVSFLVRPKRLTELRAPQLLYCYDDHDLKSFSRFETFASVPEAMAHSYDFVIVTLDGATCRGEEATRLLRELGTAMQHNDTIAVISGVGVREYCRQTMGLPTGRVIEGTMGLLSYQTDSVTLQLNPPTDSHKLARASMAYHHMGTNPGFMVIGTPKKPAQAFARLYNRSGVSKCVIIPAKFYATMSSSVFVIMAIFDLAGWPDAETLARNDELMTLGVRAIKEIMRLPEHGLIGKISSLLVTPRQLAKINLKLERDCLPVDYSAFNRFHHGGKVREQDIQVLRHCLHSGQAQGRSMTALDTLIRRYEAHIRA